MATYDNTPPGTISVAAADEFAPVAAASDVNVSLSLVPDTIGLVAMGPLQTRVLLTAQTTPSQNGIYELNDNGTFSVHVLTSEQELSETGLTPGRLYPVVCLGDATAEGLNGALTPGTSGFLTPHTDGKINMDGGALGGTVKVSFNEPNNTTLVRAADANANAEFRTGKVVSAMGGSNFGRWQIGVVGATVISVPATIPFSRLAAAAITVPGITFSNTPPGAIVV